MSSADASPSLQSVMPDGLEKPRRSWAFATVIAGITLAVMDGSVANIALPTIAREMSASPAMSIWVVNAYQLIVVGLLLPLASLGEIYGYRKVYLTGLVVFTLASLGCALSQSLGVLVIARIVQGVGAAGIMSVNTALLRYIFPQAKLGGAIGINALTAAMAATLGPTFAGLILAVATWHWLFAINIPIGLIAMSLGWRSLPDSDRVRRKFDFLGAVLTCASLGFFITSIDSIGHKLAWPMIAIQIAASAFAAISLVRHELGVEKPLLPLDLLRIPIFALSIGTSISSFAAQMLAFVALPFLFQTVYGFSATHVGLLMTPWTLSVAVSAPLAGRLADKYPAGLLGGIGLALNSIGLVALASLPAAPHIPDIVWRMSLCGIGFGLFQSPNNRTMIAASPRSRSGAASGMLGTARLLGQSTGAALVALIVGSAANAGGSHPQSLKLCIVIAAIFAAIASIISMVRLHGRAQAPEPALATASTHDLPSIPAPDASK